MGWEKGKKKLLHELSQMIAERADPEAGLLVDALARIFFRSFPAEDLEGTKVDDMYGFIYGSFNALQRWPGDLAKVSIFNPDLEKHGWESNHTTVMLVAPDMPFLLDSVRGELNRRNTTIHLLHGQNFGIERAEDGNLIAISAKGNDSQQMISLIFFGIDRRSDGEEIAEMVRTLTDILSEVACVVGDFAAMRSKLAEVTAVITCAGRLGCCNSRCFAGES